MTEQTLQLWSAGGWQLQVCCFRVETHKVSGNCIILSTDLGLHDYLIHLSNLLPRHNQKQDRLPSTSFAWTVLVICLTILLLGCCRERQVSALQCASAAQSVWEHKCYLSLLTAVTGRDGGCEAASRAAPGSSARRGSQQDPEGSNHCSRPPGNCSCMPTCCML